MSSTLPTLTGRPPRSYPQHLHSTYPHPGCPPCRGFTPALSAFFAEHGARLKLKIVFVSSDRDQAAFDSYFKEMSFGLAFPFGSKPSCGSDVRGIPTLKLYRRDGTLVTADARGKVSADPTGKSFPWA